MKLLRLINIYVLFYYIVFSINLELLSYDGYEEYEEFILYLFKDKNIYEIYIDLEKGNRESIDSAKQVVIFHLYEYFYKKTGKKIPNYNNSTLYSVMISMEEYMKKNNNSNQLNRIQYDLFFEKNKLPYIHYDIYQDLFGLVLGIEFELKKIFKKKIYSFKNSKIFSNQEIPLLHKKNYFYCDILGKTISKESFEQCKNIKISRIMTDGEINFLEQCFQGENGEVLCFDFTFDSSNEIILKNKIYYWANLCRLIEKYNSTHENKKIIFCFQNKLISEEVLSNKIILNDIKSIDNIKSYNLIEVNERDDLSNLLIMSSSTKPNLFLFSINSHNMFDKKLNSIQDAIKKFLSHKTSILDTFAYKIDENFYLEDLSDSFYNLYKKNDGEIIGIPGALNRVDLTHISLSESKGEKNYEKENKNLAEEIKSILLDYTNQFDNLKIETVSEIKEYILGDCFSTIKNKITHLLKLFDVIVIDHYQNDSVFKDFFFALVKRNPDFIITEKEMREISNAFNEGLTYHMQFRVLESKKKIIIYYKDYFKEEMTNLSKVKKVLFLNHDQIKDKKIEEAVNFVSKEILHKNKFLISGDLKKLLGKLLAEVPHILILSTFELRKLLSYLYAIHTDKKLTLEEKVKAKYDAMIYVFSYVSNIALQEYFVHNENQLDKFLFQKTEYISVSDAKDILKKYNISQKDLEELSLYLSKDYININDPMNKDKCIIAIAKIILNNENRFSIISKNEDQLIIAKNKELNMNELKKAILFIPALHFDSSCKLSNIFIKASNNSNILIEIIEKHKKQEELANKNRSGGVGPTMPTFYLLGQEDLENVDAQRVPSLLKKHIQVSIEKYLNNGDPYGVIDSFVVGGVPGIGKTAAFAYYARECIKAKKKLGVSSYNNIFYVVVSGLKSSYVSGGDAKFKSIIKIAEELHELNKDAQIYLLIDEIDSFVTNHSAGDIDQSDEKQNSYNRDFENAVLSHYKPLEKHKYIKFCFTSNKDLKTYLNPAILSRVNQGREVIHIDKIETSVIRGNLIAALRKNNIILQDEEKLNQTDLFRLKNISGGTQRNAEWWNIFMKHFSESKKKSGEKTVEDLREIVNIYERDETLRNDQKALYKFDVSKFNITESKEDNEKIDLFANIIEMVTFKGVGGVVKIIGPKGPLLFTSTLGGAFTGRMLASNNWLGIGNGVYFGKPQVEGQDIGGIYQGTLWGGLIGFIIGLMGQVSYDEGEFSFANLENYLGRLFIFEKKKPQEAVRKIDSIDKLLISDNKYEDEVQAIEEFNMHNQISLNKKIVAETYSKSFATYYNHPMMHNKDLFFKLPPDKQDQFLISRQKKLKEFLYIMATEKEFSDINLFFNFSIEQNNNNNIDFKHILFNTSFNGRIINYSFLEFLNAYLKRFEEDHNIKERYKEYMVLREMAEKYPENFTLLQETEAKEEILHNLIENFIDQMKRIYFKDNILQKKSLWGSNLLLTTVLARNNKQCQEKAEEKNKCYLKYLEKMQKQEEEKNKEYLDFEKRKKSEESESEDDKPYDGL